MACITINVDQSFKERLEQFAWINWSAVGREELFKRYLFEKYLKTKKLNKGEIMFCERIDWHPVDELPIKKEFIEKLGKIRKESHTKKMNLKEVETYLEDL